MVSGVDEAGKGPVMGPLVVAGVKVKDDSKLVSYKIRDSKKLSPRRRRYLASIINEIALKKEIVVIDAKDIDDMRKVMTMNEITVNAFSKVVQKLKPEICYVDSADVNEERFRDNILSNISFKPEIISKHKADDIYPIVGAASIIAKTYRDELVKRIEFKLRKKMDVPLGSGYPADPITQRFLKKWVNKYGKLPPHTRHSWNTAKKIMNKFSNKKLDDF
jgi:ribonuclease HII